MARRAAAGAALLAAALLAAVLGVRHGLDEDAAERHLARLLSGPGREASVEVERAEGRLLPRSARLIGVSIRLSPSDGAARGPVALHADRLELTGVSLLSLLSGGLDADGLHLEAPVLRARPPPAPDRGAGSPDRPDGGEGADGGAAVALDRLEVRDGLVVLGRDEADTPRGWGEEHVVEALALRLRDVAVDVPGTGAGRIRAGGGYLSFERYDGLLPGGMHALGAHRVEASLDDGALAIDSLDLRPVSDPEGFMRRLEHRKDRVRLVAGSIRARGVDVRRLLDRSGALARAVEVGSFAVAVHSDKRLPRRPGAPPPAMPTALLRDAGVPIAVDTVRAHDGRVEYSERTSQASRPGRVSFEEIEATAVGLANDTTRAGPGGSTVVRARSLLYGAGRLRAEFEFPVASPDLDFTFSGELGEMDVRSLNDMFVPVDGLRLVSGRVERLAFEARVRSGRASGSLRGRYAGLEMAKVDPESGDQSLPDVVESAVLGAEIHSSNPPSEDGDPRTGAIEHRRAPEDPFFQFLWEAVRSGLLSLVGL